MGERCCNIACLKDFALRFQGGACLFLAMERLGTQSCSTQTLGRGLELAQQPLGVLLDYIKQEPDDEEKKMLAEIQAGLVQSVPLKLLAVDMHMSIPCSTYAVLRRKSLMTSWLMEWVGPPSKSTMRTAMMPLGPAHGCM